MKELLRLLHFSDLHYFVGQPGAGPIRRQTVQRAGLYELAADLGGHDPNALRWLERSLVREAARNALQWQGRTFLACTGDLSTWGDDDALKESCRRLVQLERRTGLPLLMSYGDHDVWPGVVGALPCDRRQRALDAHRTDVRRRHFQRSWPEKHQVAPIAGRAAGVCCINTVMHCRYRNTYGTGTVQDDGYWDPSLRRIPSQLDELSSWLSNWDVAVILSHHPIYDPSPRGNWGSNPPQFAHVLDNAVQVADTLKVTPKHTPNGVRLVLSGHASRPFPAPGNLWPTGPLPVHGALSGNRGQLIVGSATRAASAMSNPEPAWQLVALYLDETNGASLLVERTLFGRPGVIGPFAGMKTETLHLTL